MQTGRDARTRTSSEKLRPDQPQPLDDMATTVHDGRIPVSANTELAIQNMMRKSLEAMARASNCFATCDWGKRDQGGTILLCQEEAQAPQNSGHSQIPGRKGKTCPTYYAIRGKKKARDRRVAQKV